MTRLIRTTIALLAIVLLPMVARAQTATPAAGDKPADAAAEAKPAEAPKPVTVPLPSVLSKFNVIFYGYVNFDALYDSTRSHNEGEGMDAIARPHTQAGKNSRVIFTGRNSRFGFRVNAPEYEGMKASANIEGDFDRDFSSSESLYIPQGGFRLRQANFKLETSIVDFTFGQTWQVLGWNAAYFPCDVAMLPIPGEPFGRNPQLRLSKTIKTAPMNVEFAVAALKPPQRDAGIPDFQGGIRFLANNYKGIHTAGAGGTGPYPLSLAISGAMRQYKVSFKPATTPAPTEWSEKTVQGNAISFDTLIPVVPSWSGEKANRISLIGTFVISKGAGDLLGGISGIASSSACTTGTSQCLSAALPAGNASAVYPDNNAVAWDTNGNWHAINWTGLVVGLEYYLPPSGNVFVSVNYSQAKSDNVADYAPAASQSNIYTQATHYDGNVFWDVTPAVRLGASYQHRETKYADGVKGKNDRYHFTAYYNF